MILKIGGDTTDLISYPCTSGDDPALDDFSKNYKQLSLHKRGWSQLHKKEEKYSEVIPAQAGMIPTD